MTHFSWAFVSGIEANTTGTGRFMQHLQDAILKRGKVDGTILYCPAGQILTNAAMDLLAAVPHVVVFHPQMLGVSQTLALMQGRAAAGLVTHLYMLDSFFFCRKSYNHIDGAPGPCFRCLGEGAYVNADLMGCRPWPAFDPAATPFIASLHALVVNGHVHLFAQNRKQEELARRHFGAAATITYAGLWCADWTEYVDAFLADGAPPRCEEQSPYQVVYHGSRDLAKGLGWVLDVAAHTPELRYLVPIDRGAAEIPAPANVTVTAMRWESGLRDAVQQAPLVVAPSLWSSPCEGALIKNIVLAHAPGVVDIPSAFSSEIPDNVVFKFSPEGGQAASQVRAVAAGGWRPDPETRRQWVGNFRSSNIDVAQRLLPQA